MKSIVKHYKVQPDGSLRFVGEETHVYSKSECPLQSSEETVLEERRANGRRTVVHAVPPKGRGRPADPLRRQLADALSQADVERMTSESQYDGATNADDESMSDLLPEFDMIVGEDEI